MSKVTHDIAKEATKACARKAAVSEAFVREQFRATALALEHAALPGVVGMLNTGCCPKHLTSGSLDPDTAREPFQKSFDTTFDALSVAGEHQMGGNPFKMYLELTQAVRHIEVTTALLNTYSVTLLLSSTQTLANSLTPAEFEIYETLLEDGDEEAFNDWLYAKSAELEN